MSTEPDRRFFRIVIGCYSRREGHWTARDDLRGGGFHDHQLCSMGSRRALLIDHEGHGVEAGRRREVRYDLRQIGDLEIHVSSAALFDRLWPGPHDREASLARWMTPAQSDVVRGTLRNDCPLLIVSAESAEQQLKGVQTQFRHGPTVVQTFNFAV